jgi:hypothetical protein
MVGGFSAKQQANRSANFGGKLAGKDRQSAIFLPKMRRPAGFSSQKKFLAQGFGCTFIHLFGCTAGRRGIKAG